MLRKVAGAAASKPHVEIKQSGDHFYIKTSTTVRTTEINFIIGEEFNEETVDGRKCKGLQRCMRPPVFSSPITLMNANEPWCYLQSMPPTASHPFARWSRHGPIKLNSNLFSSSSCHSTLPGAVMTCTVELTLFLQHSSRIL
ncbi:hypothetical protein GOODEAATRI_015735 [Goodea atripinnis]|uniref:Lipocalin/cytosolic fatty-acid binding domain-containing protein n=1 Tax=Goodea atripinnis TaxID=208336 RepID=A0ABV0PYC6_9TELE